MEKETFNEYYITIAEGVSPFTKRPSTAYRMAGVGMLKNPHCYKRVVVSASEPIDNPSPTPLPGDTPVAPCGLTLVESEFLVGLKESFEFQLVHKNESGIFSVTYDFDEHALSVIGDLTNGEETIFTPLRFGTYPVSIKVVYNDGQECIVQGNVTVEFVCDFSPSIEGSASVGVGGTVKVDLNHGVNIDLLRGVRVEVPAGVRQVEDYVFTSDSPGSYVIKFVADYGEGRTCEDSITIEFVASPPTCSLKVVPSKGTIKVGETVYFIAFHGNDSGTKEVLITPPKGAFEFVGDAKYKALMEGAFKFNVQFTYNDGQVCDVDVIVNVEPVPTPTPDPTPTPPPTDLPPNTAYCGQTKNGNDGYGEYEHYVTESGVYYIDYNFFSESDEMRVYVGSKLLYTTGQTKYQLGSPFGFHYKPSDGKLRVVMNEGSTGSKWSYTLYCPSSVPATVKQKGDLKIVN